MDAINDILKDNGFVFSKKFGQNFISDRNLLRAIVSDAGVTAADSVVEIGPGAGALTRELTGAALKVTAYEIDSRLAPILEKTLEGADNVEVIFKDAMTITDEELIARAGRDYILVANLPYYITTPILFRFTECPYPPRTAALMVQKEVAERLAAKPGTAQYGAITASVAVTYDVTVTRNVSRKMFTPVPNVDSAVVRLDLNPKCRDAAGVRKLIRAAFAMRRKTLSNNLTAAGISRTATESALETMGFAADIRGERLSAADFIALYELLNKNKA